MFQRNKYLVLLLFLFFSKPIFCQTVGLFSNTSDSYNGYTLIAPITSKVTYLIDNCGELVHSWESEYFPAASTYLLENGNLLRTARISSDFQGGGTGGRIEIFNWDGDLIWGYDYSSDDYHQHHDVAYMPNGNILVLAWDEKTQTEMIEAGRDSTNLTEAIRSEKIAELRPIGTDSVEVVWEWFLFDHLVQDFDANKINFGVVADHPELLDINFGPTGVDWTHFNSIDYNPQLDQIMLSARTLNEIYIIDHSTTTVEAAGHSGGNSGKGGDLIYRWGNSQSYDAGFASERKLFGQHDAQWIPEGLPDAGKILIYNNGVGRPDGDYSTVDMIDPPVDANGNYSLVSGEAFAPNQLDWTYTADPSSSFFSVNVSGANQLPNGNILICEGRTGRVFEVNAAGDILWEYINPVNPNGPAPQGANILNNTLFRSYRYSVDSPAFDGKDLTPQGPIELNPDPSNCVITDIEELSFSHNISILQNPVYDFLTISNPNAELLKIDIYNSLGRLVDQISLSDDRIEREIDDWQSGVYFVRIYIVEENVFFTNKIIKH